MMSQSENNKISSSSTTTESLLTKYILEVLQGGMTSSFADGYLGLEYQNINDSMMHELCEWIIKLDGKVELLLLQGNQITSQGASILFDTLDKSNSQIKNINLSTNSQVQDKCMKSLGEYIKSNKHIEHIDLSWNTISDAGIEILAPYLDGNTTFKRLNLATNVDITDKSTPLLMNMIKSSRICDFGINFTSISQKNIFSSSLASNALRYGSDGISLSIQDLQDEDILEISNLMKKYGIDKLKHIDLNGNRITSKGASVLFDTLRERNSIVNYIDLRLNKIDDECMKQLGEYVQGNEHLEVLDFLNNKITDKGVEILSEYLIGNTKLEELNLGYMEEITDASMPHLIKIARRSCIMEINIWDSLTSEVRRRDLDIALKIPVDQREIPIKSNSKSAAKISASTTIL